MPGKRVLTQTLSAARSSPIAFRVTTKVKNFLSRV